MCPAQSAYWYLSLPAAGEWAIKILTVASSKCAMASSCHGICYLPQVKQHTYQVGQHCPIYFGWCSGRSCQTAIAPHFFHTDLNLSLAIHHYPLCLNHKLLCSDINYFSSDKGSSALPHFLLRFIHIYISSFSWAILYICVPKAMLGLETDTVL